MKLNIFNQKFILIAVIILAAFWWSCSTTSFTMEVLKPAQISVPQNIKTIGIYNRSLPDKENKWKNILEGFISGESIQADREASAIGVNAAVNKLNTGPRFKAVLINRDDIRGTGTKQWPTPIDWGVVDNLCKQYGVDGLAFLETFDSDIRLREGSRDVKKTIDKKEVIVKEFFGDLDVVSSSGWRIYDLNTKRIIDENTYTDIKSWTARANNEHDVRKSLPRKRDALNSSGDYSGEMYAKRISPTWLLVSREYFVKKDGGFIIAQKFVQKGEWDNAMNVWKGLTESKSQKTSARACFNMAVGFEMKGDLQTALEWAKKSYQIAQTGKASMYINTLKVRISDAERIKQQMEK